MSIPQSVATILRDHVTMELEGIDRMYLNIYVPRLQCAIGVVRFFRMHRGMAFASTGVMAPITEAFVAAIESFANASDTALFVFPPKKRKEEIAQEYLARFEGEEGVLFIGKAQEKATVCRTEQRRNPQTGRKYAWLSRTTAMVNQYYFYCVDEDFGPFFLKFCSYFPYNAKLCINGHEYLKRQLKKEGIGFEALDNGLLSCENPQRAQEIADSLSAEKIADLLHKWLKRLPQPLTAEDRAAGYSYAASILQAEFSLTQVLDRPRSGRVFFEEIIRENLDIGRPEHVQLVFQRRITKRTNSRFRTRVITEGVTPSVHVDYKASRIKQYHKEGRALRTETTINNTRDFGVGRGIVNLPALRTIGFAANRRMLEVERMSHDCSMAEEIFRKLQSPLTAGTQRSSALPFGDERVQALLQAMLPFRLLPNGFSNRDLRAQLSALLSIDPTTLTQGRIQLRRLRLHGLIQRVRGTHRYRLTDFGLRIALFYTRTYARLLRPALAHALEPSSASEQEPSHLRQLAAAVNRCCEVAFLAA